MGSIQNKYNVISLPTFEGLFIKKRFSWLRFFAENFPFLQKIAKIGLRKKTQVLLYSLSDLNWSFSILKICPSILNNSNIMFHQAVCMFCTEPLYLELFRAARNITWLIYMMVLQVVRLHANTYECGITVTVNVRYTLTKTYFYLKNIIEIKVIWLNWRGCVFSLCFFFFF